MKKLIKRIAALFAAGCIFATNGMIAAIPVYAFDKDMKSDKLYQIVDGSENINDYYITYNITSGHEFNRLVWAETNYNGWDAELECNGGDKVVIEYTVNFPEDHDLMKFTNKKVTVSNTLDPDNNETFNSSGTIVLDIPKNSSMVVCRIDSIFDQIFLSIDGAETEGGSPSLSLDIEIHVTADVDENIVVSKDALESAGEDEGIELSEELINGRDKVKKKDNDKDDDDNDRSAAATAAAAVGGGGAAIAAGLAAANDAAKKKKKTSYKLHIYKDFGNGIPVGRPVYVYARIAKYENGSTSGVTDVQLTENISIDFELPMSNDPRVRTMFQAKKLYGMQNGYARFAVLVNDNLLTQSYADKDDPLILRFTFAGQGGTLTECVKFRLMGKPTAKQMLKREGGFIERAGQQYESNWLGTVYDDTPETHLLLGDSRPYSLYVKAKNFLYPAENIWILYQNTDTSLNARYTVTPVRLNNDIFELKIDNRTVSTAEKCGYKRSVDGGFIVKLSNSQGEEGELYVPVKFFHEGIFVYCGDEKTPPECFGNGCIELRTNVINDDDIEHLLPTYIRVCGAFKDPNAAAYPEAMVYLTEFPTDLPEQLIGKNEEMNTILKRLEIKIKADERNCIALIPSHVLLAEDPLKEYPCEIWAAVKSPDGSIVKESVPIKLIGEPQNGEAYSWNREVEFTRHLIDLYNIKSLSGERYDRWIAELYNHRFSAQELSFIRHRLFDIGYELERGNFKLCMDEAAFWDRCLVIAEIVKFSNDIAFAITIRAVSILVLKKNPAYVEPVANAIKKFMEDVAAEWSMGNLSEETVIKIIMDTVFSFFEDLFINLGMTADIYGLITLFVMTSFINFCRNAAVLSMENSDGKKSQTEILCKALTKCITEMSVKGIVIGISKVIEKKLPGISRFVDGNKIDVVIAYKSITVNASGEIMKMLTKRQTIDTVLRKTTIKQEILVICAENALPVLTGIEDGHSLSSWIPSFGNSPDAEKKIDEAYEKMLSMHQKVRITIPDTDIQIDVPKELVLIAVTNKLLDILGIGKVLDFFDAVKTGEPPEKIDYIPQKELTASLDKYGWKEEAARLNDGLTVN